MNSGENYPPNQPVYQGYGNPNPQVGPYPGPNNPGPPIQDGYNPYQAQMNPQYVNNPGYNQYPPGPILVNTGNQPLIAPGGRVQFYRRPCCGFGAFFSIAIVEVILYIIVMADHTIWFQYCLFNFSLFKIEYSLWGYNNNYYINISTFYNSYCGNGDPFDGFCPGFCDSISNLRDSQNYMLGLGIVSMICIGLSGFLIIWKRLNASAKIHRYVIHVLNFLTLLFFVIGFIAYIASSKFSSNFKDPDSDYNYQSPYTFSWSTGFVFSIFIIVLMGFNLLISFFIVRVIYNT